MAGTTAFGTATADIVSLWVEGVCYGLYLASCGTCARALLASHRSTLRRCFSSRTWHISLAAIFLFANSTVNMSLTLHRMLHAFGSASDPHAFEDLEETKVWFNVAKGASVSSQTLIGDAILIWRTYVVYGNDLKIIAVSTMILVADSACAIMSALSQSRQNEENSTFSREFASYKRAFWALTVAQNTITTSLLAWRIWSVDHKNREFCQQETLRRSQLRRVLHTIVGSGILYTLSTITVLVCDATSSFAVLPASAIEFMVAGIVFNIFLIRAHSEVAESSSELGSPAQMTALRFVSQNHSGGSAISGATSHSVYNSQMTRCEHCARSLAVDSTHLIAAEDAREKQVEMTGV